MTEPCADNSKDILKDNSHSITAATLLRVGVVTVSDRASHGKYADLSGPAISSYLASVLITPCQVLPKLIEDRVELIESTLIELADQASCQLIITTGGTGPAWRDVTPEATERVCQKMMPGFGEQMRQVSLKYVPTAILSRQTAGIRSTADKGSLIVNLPGSPKAISECLDAIFAAIPYCLELINSPPPIIETDPKKIVAFRPGQKKIDPANE